MFLLTRESPSPYEEKARMMPLIYEYVRENRKTNYKVPWSLWLKKKKQIE